jgi:hypothetical protein
MGRGRRAGTGEGATARFEAHGEVRGGAVAGPRLGVGQELEGIYAYYQGRPPIGSGFDGAYLGPARLIILGQANDHLSTIADPEDLLTIG